MAGCKRSVEEILFAEPAAAAKGLKTLEHIERYAMAKRAKERPRIHAMPRTFIFLGPPGAGKTSFRNKYFAKKDVYFFPCNSDIRSMWFDNYKGEPVVIFDEFEDTLPCKVLLEVMDRDTSSLQVPVKGSFINHFNPEIIIITSPAENVEWMWTASHRPSDTQRAGIRRRVLESNGAILDLWKYTGTMDELIYKYGPLDEWTLKTYEAIRAKIPATAWPDLSNDPVVLHYKSLT